MVKFKKIRENLSFGSNMLEQVNKKVLSETLSKLRESGNAYSEFEVSARSLGGPKVEVRIRNHVIRIDTAPSFGGEDSAPRPSEVALAALSGCIMQVIMWNSALHDVPIEDLTINVRARHELVSMFDPSAGWPGEANVQVEIYVKTPEPEKFEKYIMPYIAMESPVTQTFVKPIPLRWVVTVNERKRQEVYIV